MQQENRLRTFTRLAYDDNTYAQELRQSVGSINYVMQTPWDYCKPCLAVNTVNAGAGVSVCTSPSMVDVDSELQGITRKASRCSSDHYVPGGPPFCRSATPVTLCTTKVSSENTRLSWPPCTLRSTGWNRWESLCDNPQDRVEIPFDVQVNTKLLAKDLHRPIIPVPVDPAAALPPDDNTPLHPSAAFMPCQQGPVSNLPMVSWRSCAAIQNY